MTISKPILVCVCVCVCVSAQSLLAVCNPMGCSPKLPLYMEFSRQGYWSGLLLPTLRDLSDPGSEPMFLVSPALAGVFFSTVPTACFQGLSMLLQMVLFCYFLWLNNIPLYVCTKSSLSIPLLIGVYVASVSWLL